MIETSTAKHRGFLPTDLDGGTRLQLWLRADLGVEASAGKVDVWRDQSGNGHGCGQSVSTKRPNHSETNATINNRASIDFDGAGDVLDSDNFTSSGDDYLVVVCAKMTSLNDTMVSIASGPNATDEVLAFNSDSSGDLACRVRNGSLVELSGTDSGSWRVLTVQVDEAGQRFFENGVEKGFDDTSLTLPTCDRYSLGSRIDAGLFMNGSLAEVVVYEGKWTDAERGLVEAYMLDRYGL